MAGKGFQFGFPIRYLRYIIPQNLAEVDFSRGIVRDMPRSSIPTGGLYDAADYLLDQPGIARKRGGSSYQSNALGATVTGVSMVAAPEFAGQPSVVGVGADGHLYDATGGSVVDVGAFGITTVDNPKLYPGSPDKLIVTSSDGTTGPKKIYISTGAVTFGAISGSPSPGRYVTIHANRPVLANTAANPNNIYFGPAPNIDSAWDSNSFIGTNHQLTGIASIQGVLLAFSAGATERITGSIPPNVSGENMSLQPLGQIGCCDARSIAPWGSYVIFASQDGVWVTNGAGFDSLMEKRDGSGILSYWRSLYAQVNAAGGIIAGGIFSKNYYFLSLTGISPQVTLMCYLPSKSWWRVTNIGSRMFAPSSVMSDELYAATASGLPGNRLLKLSGLFSPASGNKNDADGTAVTPLLETRMIGQGIGLKAYEFGHLLYDMRDAASDNPTMAVQVSRGLEAEGSYTAVAESPLAEVTQAERKRFGLNFDAQSVQLKFQQTNASSKTEIYAIEVEQRNATYADAEFVN